MSFIVTPAGFFTIVHQGENSVMIMSSPTRGRVAGSSFAVKGRSRSRASALKPVACPEKRTMLLLGGRNGCAMRRTSVQVEQELEAAVRVGEDRVELELAVKEVQVRLRQNRTI